MMNSIVTHLRHLIEDPFFFEGVTVLFSALIVLRLFSEIALALRAKRRARYLLQAAKERAEFRSLIHRAYAEQLTSHAADMEQLRISVEKQIGSMSEKDRRMVQQGLNQRNKRGSDRYLKEIVGGEMREVA